MLKAHSLLYAIYICLIISIICGGILYYFNLYNQLNNYYNRYEDLYVHNYSTVNYAIGVDLVNEDLPENIENNIKGNFTVSSFGVLQLIIANSSIETDTISSAHLVGELPSSDTAIFLSSISKPLLYSGKVEIVGNNRLPFVEIIGKVIDSKKNELKLVGSTFLNEGGLPSLNREFIKMYDDSNFKNAMSLSNDLNEDSIYFNSFFNQPSIKELTKPGVQNIVYKGNIILRGKDSLVVKKSAILKDVILFAPRIIFEEGFSGNVQAYATSEILIKKNVNLNYPSVLCVYNSTKNESSIIIQENCTVSGAIVLFGNELDDIEKNKIMVDSSGFLEADIYCTGALMLKSNVYGSIYTNRFYYRSSSSSYDNLISDIKINVKKRPSYFVPIQLLNKSKSRYGIIKRVF